MRRRTARTSLLLVAVAVPALAGGCRSLVDPFMGVPEWQTVRYDEDAPDPALDGVPRITAVQEREYGHYVHSASAGRIVAREFRDDWVYYAVATRRIVRKPGAGPAGSDRAVAVVYERYRARQPPRPAPEPPPAWAAKKPEPGKGRPSTTASDVEEIRKRVEEELEERWKKGAGPKSIRPGTDQDKE